MTDLPIWAKNKAREWLGERSVRPLTHRCAFVAGEAWVSTDGLAVLLVEVAQAGRDEAWGRRSELLAQVRRVVVEERNDPPRGTDRRYKVCNEILARLEKL